MVIGVWGSGRPLVLGTSPRRFESCHSDHFGDLCIIANTCNIGAALVVAVVINYRLWRVNQSRYWVVLLRLTLLFGVRCKSYALLQFIK